MHGETVKFEMLGVEDVRKNFDAEIKMLSALVLYSTFCRHYLGYVLMQNKVSVKAIIRPFCSCACDGTSTGR
jgi:hypothetical protein